MEKTFFIDPNNQSAADARKSYNLVNEYLENPNKQFEYYLGTHKRGSGTSLTKKDKIINYPGKQFIQVQNMHMSKKRLGSKNITGPKKINFKSFDQRRAMTKVGQREHSLDDPPNYSYSNPLRSSSVCHKKSMSNDKLHSGQRNKATKTTKSTSHRGKKIKQRSQMSAIQKASTAQGMISLIKT